MGSLVWIKGRRGPEPQKWPADAPAKLAEHPLDADAFALPIAELARRYPAPAVEA